MEIDPADVLAFWFGEPAKDFPTLAAKAKRWFMGGPELDRDIRERFGVAIEQALEGGLETWTRTTRGRLALILVLDQFTRSAFRDDPRAFAGDARAQRLAVEALDAGLDRELDVEERNFMLLPLGHAEDLALQERGMVEVDRLVADVAEWQRPVFAMGVEQSRKYREVIARFGRFPHRNQVLGRSSTPEEASFLADWKEKQRPSTFDKVTS